MPRLLTPRQGAELLGVTCQTLIDLIHRGEVPAVKFGGQWRIPAEALQQSIDSKLAARSGN